MNGAVIEHTHTVFVAQLCPDINVPVGKRVHFTVGTGNSNAAAGRRPEVGIGSRIATAQDSLILDGKTGDFADLPAAQSDPQALWFYFHEVEHNVLRLQ